MTKLFGCCCLRRNKTNKVKEEETVLFREERPPQDKNGTLKEEELAEHASQKIKPLVVSEKPTDVVAESTQAAIEDVTEDPTDESVSKNVSF